MGKATDNLLEAARHANLIEKIPGVGKLAKWTADKTFHVVLPAYITAAFRVAFARNTRNFPELSEAQVARRSAKEVNEFFFNLGTQGVLKSRTMRSAARVLLFAPGVVEGRFRSEARGATQAGRTFADGVRGKGWRVGSAARAMGQILLASIIGAQALNMFTRGKPTWENEEEGHRWDAYIPGGKLGFFFSPLSLCAEFSHALLKYIEGGESPLDALAHIGQNKLSGLSRAALDLTTGHDSMGRPFGSTSERLKAAALDASPLPMQAGALVKKDPKSPVGLSLNVKKDPSSALGYSFNGQAGQEFEKSLFNAAGIRLDAGQSARAQMYQLAKPFRKDGDGQQPHAPSAYADLRRMLEDGDADGARAEVHRLVSTGHKPDKIRSAFGIGADGGVKTPNYTGSKETEKKMLGSLTVSQRRTYFESLKEYAQTAQALKRVMGGGVPAMASSC